MTTRRHAIAGLLGGAAASALPLQGALAAALQGSAASPSTVKPARWHRHASPKVPAPYLPTAIYRTDHAQAGYIEEEWFASGVDDLGQPYTTQVYIWRPSDPARFSGTILAEPLHALGVPPMMQYVSPYVARAGHGWAMIGSQKTPIETYVRSKDPDYYSLLRIEPASGVPTKAPDRSDAAAFSAYRDGMNQASNAILAQVGAALRSTRGPFRGLRTRHVILMGHSQTGGVVTRYIAEKHAAERLSRGRPIYDGYFPSGAPRTAFGPRDVPLIQLVSEGDVSDADRRGPEFANRRYRRPDSDDPNDRYRLYELAGTSHMGTRYPPHSDPASWKAYMGEDLSGLTMNSMPHHEQFAMGVHHLVQWVTRGVTPPRAPRLEEALGRRYLAKDEHGNTLGGIRSPQMDVPRATYVPNPVRADGVVRAGVVGFEVAFTPEKMRALYGTPANYVSRFNARLEEVTRDGWLLPEDADEMRAEAARQRF